MKAMIRIALGCFCILLLVVLVAVVANAGGFSKRKAVRDALCSLVYNSSLPQTQREQRLKAVGPAAVPVLVQIMDESSPPLLESWSMRMEAMLTDKRMTAARMRAAAAQACGILGSNAEPAIPALTRMFDRRESWAETSLALVKISPLGIRVLTNALAQTNQSSMEDIQVRNWAAQLLKWARFAREPARDALVRALGDPDPGVRQQAAWSLGFMSSDAETSVVALAHALGDSSSEVQESALAALGQIGVKATSAVPHLIEYIKTNSPVRGSGALASLRKIDPVAANEFP